MTTRRVAVLTTGRQDWGILRSTCSALHADPEFDLRLIVGGMHCAKSFGQTERMLAEEGFAASERLEWVDAHEDSPSGQAGIALHQVGDALVRQRPESLILVGDRFETAAAALAATIQLIPIVHLHGGEETEGAFDNALRHAVTKLSHLHLVSHKDHGRRVVAMGERSETVHVVGAPGLDNLHRSDLANREELEEFLGIKLVPPVIVVTVHPATLVADPLTEGEAVVAAMDSRHGTYVITLPNTDPGHGTLRTMLIDAGKSAGRVAVEALGERRYWGLLKIADAMVGNSSSALIEAPAVGLPAVNIGDRQKGRLRSDNVVDVPADAARVCAALTQVLTREFRSKLSKFVSDKPVAEHIVEILRQWTPPDPPTKPGMLI